MPHELNAPEGCPPIRLRPLTVEDSSEWNEVRWRNDDWLSPWESGDPMHGPGMSYNAWIAWQRRSEQAGTGVIFAIEYQWRIVGQISIGAICYGAMRSGVIGYWVDESYIGRGFAPTAVAVLADWALVRGCTAWRSRSCRRTSARWPWRGRSGPGTRVCDRAICMCVGNGGIMRPSRCWRRTWGRGSRGGFRPDTPGANSARFAKVSYS